jgi:hypothetical protein
MVFAMAPGVKCWDIVELFHQLSHHRTRVTGAFATKRLCAHILKATGPLADYLDIRVTSFAAADAAAAR